MGKTNTAATPGTEKEQSPLDKLIEKLETVHEDAPYHPDPRAMVKQMAAGLLEYFKTPD